MTNSTTLLGALISVFLVAFGLLWLAAKRPSSRALLYWGLAHAALGFTGIFYAFRVIYEQTIFVVAANACYILFVYLLLVGTLIFTNRPLPPKLLAALFVFLEACQILIAVTMPRPFTQMTGSLIGALLLFYTAYALFLRHRERKGVGYGLVGGIMALRALNTLAFPWLVQTGSIEYVFLASQIFVVLTGISLIIIEQQETLHVLKQREAELNATEIQLRAAKDRAEQANAAKTRFLAAASHDLRQPLQAQILYHDILAHSESGPKSAVIIARMGEVLQAQQAMLDLLLDVSRLDAGIVEVARADFPIDPLLDRLAHEFDLQAAARGLQLRKVRCSAVIHTDAVLIERMLRNLLTNAIKYTERGGILLGCRRSGGFLTVQVWDTGPGIPRDKLAAIFEEFMQLANPARDRRHGLGLGLAIVERLARLLGLQIGVRSVPGRGSMFEIAGAPLSRQPLSRQPPSRQPPSRQSVSRPPANRRPALRQRPAPRPEPPASGADRWIALVEDDGHIMNALEQTLTMARYTVIAGDSIEQVVARCREHRQPPDVILADYRLGRGQTGTEAIARLRTEFGPSIAGILLTGDTSPARLQEAKSSGFAVLHKPVQADVLIRAIEQALVCRPFR